jgi:hypothetical protein
MKKGVNQAASEQKHARRSSEHEKSAGDQELALEQTESRRGDLTRERSVSVASHCERVYTKSAAFATKNISHIRRITRARHPRSQLRA